MVNIFPQFSQKHTFVPSITMVPGSSNMAKSCFVVHISVKFIFLMLQPGSSPSRSRDPPFLLPWASCRRWQLPHVPSGDWEVTQACSRLCHARDEGHEGQDQLRPHKESPWGCDGVPSCEPSPGLPHLWSGWWMWLTRSVYGLRVWQKSLHWHSFFWKAVSIASYKFNQNSDRFINL